MHTAHPLAVSAPSSSLELLGAERPSEQDALRGAELTSVRAWARSRGYPIDETSGVPLPVLRTYRKVHAG